jgi:hypothetical protein
MRRVPLFLLALVLTSCGGDPPSAAAADLPGAWEVRWPAVFRDLRFWAGEDPGRADRLKRAQESAHADLDLVLEEGGRATLTYRNEPPIVWTGTWKRSGEDVRLDLTNPQATKPTTLTYHWKGGRLWFDLQVDPQKTTDDSVPVALVRAKR